MDNDIETRVESRSKTGLMSCGGRLGYCAPPAFRRVRQLSTKTASKTGLAYIPFSTKLGTVDDGVQRPFRVMEYISVR